MRRLALSAGLLAASMAAAQADCRVLDGDIRKAVGAGEVARFAGLHETMLADATCDAAYRKTVGRVLALASLKQLQAGPLAENVVLPIGDLTRAAQFGQPWQLMAAIGDAHYEAQQWTDAVRSYESALGDLRDKAANPAAAPREVEEKLVKRAYQARALAPHYVATSLFRGNAGGPVSPEWRGFTAQALPVPVRLAGDKPALDEDGEAAARDILVVIGNAKTTRIRLIGHTDAAGSGDAMRASEALAQAVAAYLKANGYAGGIEIVGKGAAEPFQPDEPERYDAAQRHRFDRRVEVQVLTD